MSDEDPSLKIQKLCNNEFTSRSHKTINLYCFLQCQTSENFMLSFAVKLKVFIKWRRESLCIFHYYQTSTFSDDQKLFKEISVFASTFRREHVWRNFSCKYNNELFPNECQYCAKQFVRLCFECVNFCTFRRKASKP